MDNQAYITALMNIYDSVPESKRQTFTTLFSSEMKNTGLIFGFSVFLGGLGIDRFLLGHILPGILKLITLGGFGIWQIVDWFLVGNAARRQNIALAERIKMELS